MWTRRKEETTKYPSHLQKCILKMTQLMDKPKEENIEKHYWLASEIYACVCIWREVSTSSFEVVFNFQRAPRLLDVGRPLAGGLLPRPPMAGHWPRPQMHYGWQPTGLGVRVPLSWAATLYEWQLCRWTPPWPTIQEEE